MPAIKPEIRKMGFCPPVSDRDCYPVFGANIPGLCPDLQFNRGKEDQVRTVAFRFSFFKISR
jgi:hypothetical protein